MSEAKGIESVLNLIDGVKLIAEFGKKVSADKKVGLEDLPALLDLVQKSDMLVKAVQGFGEVEKELKDLSLEESQMILSKLFEAAKSVQMAA